MEVRFAARMKEYEEGIFQVLKEKKEELESRGRKVYNFSVGTPDFAPRQEIMDAVAQAASRPENYKYALRDLSQLTEAVIRRYKRRYGVTSVSYTHLFIRTVGSILFAWVVKTFINLKISTFFQIGFF